MLINTTFCNKALAGGGALKGKIRVEKLTLRLALFSQITKPYEIAQS